MSYPTMNLILNPRTCTLHVGRNHTSYCNNRYSKDNIMYGEITCTTAEQRAVSVVRKPCSKCFPDGIEAFVAQRKADIAE